MKNLTLLNDVTNIKLGNTATTIQFKVSDDGEPVTLKDSQKAVFRIKNSIGFLKSIPSGVVMNNQIFQFDSTNLAGLVPDAYYLENDYNYYDKNNLTWRN